MTAQCRIAGLVSCGYDEDVFLSAFEAHLRFCRSRLADIVEP